ncbi:hypothetical protein [Anoxynatronum sibiricum]|uniref:Uncharacterized protein n=1 Tax=Anoxynatronum sibiricum TaxID=210623 RepID=A0ABU9VVU5_9CLOT
MNKANRHQTTPNLGGSQFLVNVRYQQNHSWQGSIQRLDTGETINFRSALELMTLMEAAVKQQGDRHLPETDLRNWKTQKKEVKTGKKHHEQLG